MSKEMFMFQIGRALISLDIIVKKFCCNIAECKGLCCVKGDRGAPLEAEELEEIKINYSKIKSYLRHESIEVVEMLGYHLIDSDDDCVTQLVNSRECAFVIFEKGIAKCAFEKGFEEGICDFKKPLSCHLYPIRIKKYPEDANAYRYLALSLNEGGNDHAHRRGPVARSHCRTPE